MNGESECIIHITLQLSPFTHQLFLNMLYLIINVWNNLFYWLIDDDFHSANIYIEPPEVHEPM